MRLVSAMSRIARIVIPGFPHHVIQRGNRRQTTFFKPEDYQEYLRLLSFWCRKHGVLIWVYCLMTNHVHLILVPESLDGLRLAIGKAHREYSCHVNFREGWRGHLFQGRFSSYPLDPRHLLTAARYIERNPVEAGLVDQPEAYPWSSARAHITGERNVHLDFCPLIAETGTWKDFLMTPLGSHEALPIERHERTGRPLGDRVFITQVERRTGRSLFPKRPGPKKRQEEWDFSN